MVNTTHGTECVEQLRSTQRVLQENQGVMGWYELIFFNWYLVHSCGSQLHKVPQCTMTELCVCETDEMRCCSESLQCTWFHHWSHQVVPAASLPVSEHQHVGDLMAVHLACFYHPSQHRCPHHRLATDTQQLSVLLQSLPSQLTTNFKSLLF